MDKTTTSAADYAGWQELVRTYQQPNLRLAIWQIVTSFGGLLASVGLMVLSLQVSYALTLLLAVFAAGFLVRVFIIQHDCGHGSFFGSTRANDLLGAISGVLTMVPYRFWRKTHAIHHAHHAELEGRGIGDVWTLTVREYEEARWWTRVAYRVFRHPLFLFAVAPPINFIVLQRFPLKARASWHTGEVASVWWTDLAIVGLLGAAAVALGPLQVLKI